MTTTKVFIISNHLMFSQGLENLLGQNENLITVGQEAQVDRAIEQIKELEPDVVLLDSTETEENSAPEVVRILKTIPSVKVIGLSLRDNEFYIYRASQWTAETVEDLVAAIENQTVSVKIDGQQSTADLPS